MFESNQFRDDVKDYGVLLKDLRKSFKHYIKSSELKSVCLGVSGGIDSALAAVVVKPVCDELGIPLIGTFINIETNKINELIRANDIGKHFVTVYNRVDLSDEYNMMKKTVSKIKSVVKTEAEYETKIRLGNIKCRLRMIYIYDLAQSNNGLTLGGESLTEYYTSFFTKNGDSFDYEIFANIWKTNIYRLAQYIVDNELKTQAEKDALLSCISAQATDGLGITNGGDLEQFGCKSFIEADDALQQYTENGLIIHEKIIKRHIDGTFKRNLPITPKTDTFWL